MKKTLLSFYLLLSAIYAFPHQSKIDSLLHLLKKDKEDTSKVSHLNNLSREYFLIGSYDSCIAFTTTALELAQHLNPLYKKGIATAYNILGNANRVQGNYPQSVDFFLKALKIDEELKDKSGIAKVLGNIGITYGNQGDYIKALDYYFKALKMDEELGNKSGIARHLGNIGVVYKEQGDYPKALDYYFKALKIGEELGNKIGIEADLSNIGNIYDKQKDHTKALEYSFKALKIAEELGDKNGIAEDLSNIGGTYEEQGKSEKSKSKSDSLFNKALEYSFKGLKILEELGNKYEIAIGLGNIGSLYTDTKKYAEAEKYLLNALRMDKETGALIYEKDVENYLTDLYTKTNRYQLALEHYKNAMVLKDSIFNQEKNKEITRKEMNYEFEKKEAVTKAEHDAETKQQKIVIWSVIGGLLLVVVFAGFIFRSLRVTRKQKTIIEEQKQLVEEHQKDIIDSITYAKRLQEAILPPLDFVKKHLPDSFILYKPKDIVAGDFYWMECLTPSPSPKERGDSPPSGELEGAVIFIAACDCTGHGVPGAMVSVVCSNALNRTVKEFGLRDTGKILDKVTELVVETFEKSDKDVKDGMDISLMAINFSKVSPKESSRTNFGKVTIQWSGANNPLWYIQNGELIDITADKQPIGKHDNRKPFTAHTICLPPTPSFRGGEVLPEGQPQVASEAHLGGASTFYLFTDGFADQFGGPKGKKFKYKQLEEKLLAISSQPMAEQKKSLEQAFDNWKGNVEQVDDVLVIALRI